MPECSRNGAAPRSTTQAPSSFDLYARSGNVENPERNWSDWEKSHPIPAHLGTFCALRAVEVGASKSGRDRFHRPQLSAGQRGAVGRRDCRPARCASQLRNAQVQQQPQTVNISFPSTQSNMINFPESRFQFSRSPGFATRARSRCAGRRMTTTATISSTRSTSAATASKDWRLLKDDVTEKLLLFRRRAAAGRRLSRQGRRPAMRPRTIRTKRSPPTAPATDLSSIRRRRSSRPEAHLEGDTVSCDRDATDASSPIAHAEYSIDAGPWQYIEPVGKLSRFARRALRFLARPLERCRSASRRAHRHAPCLRSL